MWVRVPSPFIRALYKDLIVATVEVEYHCDECTIDFCVYHTTDQRNTHCCYCGKPVRLTGRVSQLENREIVTYLDGLEIERRPAKNMPVL